MHAIRWLALAVLLAANAPAQDLVQVSPAIAKVEYEDATIRVVRSHYEPGASSAMHKHPARVVISLIPASFRLSRPDGSSITPPPDPQLRPLAFGAESHAVTNIGNTPAENIEIEFKGLAEFGALRTAPLESSADPNSLLHEPHHHWLMESPWFRVVEARIPPGDATQWHRHSHSNVSVRIGGSEVSTQARDGEWSKPASAAAGSIEFRNVEAPYEHRVRNNGSGEYRVVLIELLRRDEH